MTHIRVSNLNIIDSDTGLSPGRRKAIIWTNAWISLIGPFGANFSEVVMDIYTLSLKRAENGVYFISTQRRLTLYIGS